MLALSPRWNMAQFLISRKPHASRSCHPGREQARGCSITGFPFAHCKRGRRKETNSIRTLTAPSKKWNPCHAVPWYFAACSKADIP